MSEGVFCEDTFEVFGCDAELEIAAEGDGDASCLLADDNSEGICLLGNTHGGTMTKAEFLWHTHVVGDREDATSGDDTLVGDNHSAIVERRVLEEDVLYQAL